MPRTRSVGGGSGGSESGQMGGAAKPSGKEDRFSRSGGSQFLRGGGQGETQAGRQGPNGGGVVAGGSEKGGSGTLGAGEGKRKTTKTAGETGLGQGIGRKRATKKHRERGGDSRNQPVSVGCQVDPGTNPHVIIKRMDDRLLEKSPSGLVELIGRALPDESSKAAEIGNSRVNALSRGGSCKGEGAKNSLIFGDCSRTEKFKPPLGAGYKVKKGGYARGARKEVGETAMKGGKIVSRAAESTFEGLEEMPMSGEGVNKGFPRTGKGDSSTAKKCVISNADKKRGGWGANKRVLECSMEVKRKHDLGEAVTLKPTTIGGVGFPAAIIISLPNKSGASAPLGGGKGGKARERGCGPEGRGTVEPTIGISKVKFNKNASKRVRVGGVLMGGRVKDSSFTIKGGEEGTKKFDNLNRAVRGDDAKLVGFQQGGESGEFLIDNTSLTDL